MDPAADEADAAGLLVDGFVAGLSEADAFEANALDGMAVAGFVEDADPVVAEGQHGGVGGGSGVQHFRFAPGFALVGAGLEREALALGAGGVGEEQSLAVAGEAGVATGVREIGVQGDGAEGDAAVFRDGEAALLSVAHAEILQHGTIRKFDGVAFVGLRAEGGSDLPGDATVVAIGVARGDEAGVADLEVVGDLEVFSFGDGEQSMDGFLLLKVVNPQGQTGWSSTIMLPSVRGESTSS